MRSIWWEGVDAPRFNELDKDIKTDVLIIGGGIAGILTAYFLHNRGVDYVLLEKERICGGTTGGTTGKITVGTGLAYGKIESTYGIEGAQLYYKAQTAALNRFAEICESVDCDFERRDNYVFSRTDADEIHKEVGVLRLVGCPAEFRTKTALPFNIAGAVRVRDQAQYHPLKFLFSIASGLNIYENSFVREMVGNTAVTDRGSVHAKRVVVATHFPFINKHGAFFLKLYQNRSYVLALENAGDVGGMYVDADSSGISFRNYGKYLFLGGAAHRTGKNEGCFDSVRELAGRYYPDSVEKYEWAAQDCMSLDSMPYIGRYSRLTSGLFVASGFSKWGMTGSMIAATELSKMLCGETSEFAELFSPSRRIWHKQLGINGVESVKNLLTVGGKRCPHLGCALRYNSAEHTWDCPCHGSRFTVDGKLLDNPANGDLKK